MSARSGARGGLAGREDPVEESRRMLRIASHEIRGPLAVVSTILQKLLRDSRGRLAESQRESVERALRQTDRLLSVLQELLELTGPLGRRGAAAEPEPVLREVAEGFRDLAAERGIAIELRGAGLPRIAVEELLLFRLLSNLLDNAVRYAAARVTVEASSRDDGLVEFSVSDDGPGISPERREALFRPAPSSSRGGAGASGSYRGTGLGLLLCREIVESVGGWIRADKRRGGGARFSFAVPAAGAPPP